MERRFVQRGNRAKTARELKRDTIYDDAAQRRQELQADPNSPSGRGDYLHLAARQANDPRPELVDFIARRHGIGREPVRSPLQNAPSETDVYNIAAHQMRNRITK